MRARLGNPKVSPEAYALARKVALDSAPTGGAGDSPTVPAHGPHYDRDHALIASGDCLCSGIYGRHTYAAPGCNFGPGRLRRQDRY